MLRRDKIAAFACMVLAALLFVVTFRPALRSIISDSALFSAVSVVLAVLGIYHIATARDRAERFSRVLSAASPIRRMWLPPRFYAANTLLWNLRVGGGIALFSAVMLAVVAFLAHRSGG